MDVVVKGCFIAFGEATAEEMVTMTITRFFTGMA
jgi:hypothetical protein